MTAAGLRKNKRMIKIAGQNRTFDKEKTDARFTFHVVQGVPQHFKHTHVEGVTECFVVQVDSRISLNKKEKKPRDQLIYIKPFPI